MVKVLSVNGKIPLVDGKAISATGGGSVPKPLTYDYMPEGYPRKSVQTTTLAEEQEIAFVSKGTAGQYAGSLPSHPKLVEGQTYAVNWDGTEYECVCVAVAVGPQSLLALGNLSIMGVGVDTGEPFLYSPAESIFITLDTSASHTISVKRVEETVTPMADKFLPASVLITYDLGTDTYGSDLTNDELYARLLDGKQIVLYKTDGNQYLYLTKWTKLSSGRIDLAFAGEDYSVSLKTDGTIGKKPMA